MTKNSRTIDTNYTNDHQYSQRNNTKQAGEQNKRMQQATLLWIRAPYHNMNNCNGLNRVAKKRDKRTPAVLWIELRCVTHLSCHNLVRWLVTNFPNNASVSLTQLAYVDEIVLFQFSNGAFGIEEFFHAILLFVRTFKLIEFLLQAFDAHVRYPARATAKRKNRTESNVNQVFASHPLPILRMILLTGIFGNFGQG